LKIRDTCGWSGKRDMHEFYTCLSASKQQIE
jgi:hypothetical protein